MIVALETAGMTTTLWLFDSDATSPVKALEIETWESGRRLSEELLARINGLVGRHGGALPDITGMVVLSGPGSFTSLRIGHAVANALADGLAVPVVGAQGEDWLQAGLRALKTTKSGTIALPVYGGEPNITKPKG